MNQMQMESETQRFEWRPDGESGVPCEPCGFVDYHRFGNIAIVTHTETSPSLTGKGHGSRLAAAALDWMAQQGLHVVPVCGFMAHFLRTHPEHQGVLTPTVRAIFAIPENRA
ncbi:GNAT family N-acetyltransferase [Oxalicibacterium solurbis]|uniref:N-acetyltransferase domain-containing protein n=1 Tax=Oxalicibacterium solurbis TaxID=69280 RepID=A0A8J3F4B4_9BURK|nr:GNAT family N-acetyltransferase [Oxalicibacterium solurbis]GGI52894.1 hypothetical protein GCM10011430_00680 [Oxalicibacterium solurbis]